MLFNSYLFIFIFLPLTFFLFYFVGRRHHQLGLVVLCFASFVFYAWTSIYCGLILFFSIVVNFYLSRYLITDTSLRLRQILFGVGLFFNLGLLCYFKYANFFIENINLIASRQFDWVNIVLPIGISFFTFTQLAYLIDSYRCLTTKNSFLHYALFVTYFPHLIAGPIIHHAEIMPQFENTNLFKIKNRNLLIGFTLFSIGLFKKVILADYFAKLVGPVFDSGMYLSSLDAWVGSLAYTFELYFDFSGYSDMAVGLSLLFSIKLPINFYSPYKANNIIEFWHRWNMTLSRFLRNYLYISLGGNRKGPWKRYRNLLITMILGGLWHGANWTFVIWGGLHGVYLCINHAWIALKKYLGLSLNHYTMTLMAKCITFVAVVVAWVFFRAADLKTAFNILYAMFNISFASLLTGFHVLKFFSVNKIILFIFISVFIIWQLPNSYQFLNRFKPSLTNPIICASNRLLWRPNLFWTSIISLMLVMGICYMQTSNTFLYFQF